MISQTVWQLSRRQTNKETNRHTHTHTHKRTLWKHITRHYIQPERAGKSFQHI